MTTETLLIKRARKLLSRARELQHPPEHLKKYGKAPISDLTRELMALEAAADKAEGVEAGTQRKPYKATTKASAAGGERMCEEHESFGMLQFGRVSGRTHLYGSHLESHQHYIMMRVHRGRVEHDLSRDWYYARGLPIVEVALSAAQFAEAITTMNMGSGVPCTIESVEGVMYEDVPDSVTAENVKVREGFKRDIARTVRGVRELYETIDKLVETGSSVSKGRAREMRDAVRKYLNRIDRDAGFVVDSFQESAENVVSQSKAEIESMLTLALHRAGMDHLRGLSTEDARRVLAGEAPKLTDGDS